MLSPAVYCRIIPFLVLEDYASIVLHISREIEQTTSYLWPFFSHYYYLHCRRSRNFSRANKSDPLYEICTLSSIYFIYWMTRPIWYGARDEIFIVIADHWANEERDIGYWYIWLFNCRWSTTTTKARWRNNKLLFGYKTNNKFQLESQDNNSNCHSSGHLSNLKRDNYSRFRRMMTQFEII